MENYLKYTYIVSAIYCLIMVVQDMIKRYYKGLNTTRQDIGMSLLVIFFPILNSIALFGAIITWTKGLFSDKVVIRGRNTGTK